MRSKIDDLIDIKKKKKIDNSMEMSSKNDE